MRIAMTFSPTPSKIVMDMDRIQAILETIRKFCNKLISPYQVRMSGIQAQPQKFRRITRKQSVKLLKLHLSRRFI